jgi:shikimate kinase
MTTPSNIITQAGQAHPDLVFLIGYMGSGKTTLGKKLAAKMHYHFIDLDNVFESKQGCTITDYFNRFGEEAFRKEESRVLKGTSFPINAVISTGGGLPCFFDHMEWMNAHGKTVYIKLPAKTLAGRLDPGKEARPILSGKHGQELLAFIEEKLSEREAYYNQARIIVDGLSLTAEKLENIVTRS